MNLTAFLIDTPAMLGSMPNRPVDLSATSRPARRSSAASLPPGWTTTPPVLILKTAAYIGDDPLLRMAFSGRARICPQEDQTDWEAYATYSTRFPPRTTFPYSRYWQSATFALRLLLCLFTFTNLQMLLPSLRRRRCSFGRCC